MAAALAHRGPDGTGIAVAGNVGLVETRLAIRGHGAAEPPAGDRQTGAVLVLECEALNGEALRAELGGRPFETAGDAETVLRAMAEQGTRALTRLDDCFALAHLDSRGRQLVLARGGVGMKPLHWAQHGGAVWFASEVQALSAAGVRGVVRTDVLRRVASLGWEGREETLIDPVRRLLPGCLLRIDLGSLDCSVERFYDLNAEVDEGLQAELAALPRKALRDLLEERMDAAVAKRLGGDPPVAFFCSGGVDSSLLTALGQRRRPGGTAFVASMQAGHLVDEAPYARLLALELGMELEVVRITAANWREAFVDAVFHHGAPMAQPVGVALSQVAAEVARGGFKAALVGNGADALFGGDWGRHREAFLDFLPASARARRRMRLLREAGPRGVVDTVRQRLSRTPPAGWLDFGGTWEWEDEVTIRAVRAYGESGPRGRLAGRMLSDFSLNLTPGLVRFDANIMQHGVESRSPFLDREVLRLVLNMPLEARVSGSPKGILDEVAARYVPRAIMRRPKVGGMLTGSSGWITEAARPEFLREGMLGQLLEIDAARWRQSLDVAPRDQVFAFWTAEVWARLTVGGASPDEVKQELWVA